MPLAQDDAQALCTTTEWNTVVNTFSPRVEELSPAVAKKQANRIRKFLAKEESSEADKKKIALFTEALERLQPHLPEKKDDDKLTARRDKEKAAKDRNKEVREKRTDVRDRMTKKAEEEAAEKDGEAGDDVKSGKGPDKPSFSGLQKSGKRSQGKIGTRKV